MGGVAGELAGLEKRTGVGPGPEGDGDVHRLGVVGALYLIGF